MNARKALLTRRGLFASARARPALDVYVRALENFFSKKFLLPKKFMTSASSPIAQGKGEARPLRAHALTQG
jgi:hypothetical protein